MFPMASEIKRHFDWNSLVIVSDDQSVDSLRQNSGITFPFGYLSINFVDKQKYELARHPDLIITQTSNNADMFIPSTLSQY